MIDPNTKTTMVAPDGGVRYIPFYMRDQMLKQGWKVINNPKVEYYPEFDQTLQGNTTISEIIEEEESNLLEVKII